VVGRDEFNGPLICPYILDIQYCPMLRQNSADEFGTTYDRALDEQQH
jgi:hypothetical protein